MRNKTGYNKREDSAQNDGNKVNSGKRFPPRRIALTRQMLN